MTEAAKLLRIGRPALSTFLSGRSALSIDLARRIESVFGEPAAELLRMQTEYDAGSWRAAPKIAAIGPYVPLLGRIRQEQIEAWASKIQARAASSSTSNPIPFHWLRARTSRFPGERGFTITWIRRTCFGKRGLPMGTEGTVLLGIRM